MKVGVIGAGMISEVYLDNMVNKFGNLEVLAIADMNMENAKRRAEQFGVKACSVEEILSNSEIEMIVNLTPLVAHYSVVKQALEAGKHVYTEKTIAQTTKQAKELLNLAVEKGLYLGAAPDTFLGSALQAAKTAIEDNLIGEIHSFAISANRNNQILLSAIPFLRTPGIGVLLDYGVYYVTALCSLLGPVERVGGMVGTPIRQYRNIIPQSPEFGKMIDNPNETQISAILKLKNGITGTFHIDTDSLIADEAIFAIYGEKGVLYLSDPNQFGGEIKYQPNSIDPMNPVEPVTLWQFTPYSENDRGVGPAEMAKAIEAGTMQRTSKEMAYHVLDVLEQILACGENGGFMNIDSSFDVMPEGLKQKKVDIQNIGHITFQVKDVAGMRKFYTEVLGMKPLFKLTVRDLADSLKQQYGDSVVEQLAPLLNAGVEIPWIEYFKLADRQYLEFFYDLGNPYGDSIKYEEYYGFKKVNYEVDDIQLMYERVVNAGIEVKEEVHPTADGSVEFSVFDPDGNEIQFTQYTEHTLIPISSAQKRESFSNVRYTTQIALNVEDEVNMMNFYTRGLGLKKAFTLTYDMIAQYMEKAGNTDIQTITSSKMMGNIPCIDYIEVAPHQFIEFFYCMGQHKKEKRDRSKIYGYQHFCLEVPDIKSAWEAVVYNGIHPDTEIALGTEGAYRFWITDPDGNKLELMEYAPGAKQLL